MQKSGTARVTITEEGRSGSVTFHENDRSLSGWWEFAGNDAVALVYLGPAAQWQPQDIWPEGEHSGIFRFVADEVIRQKCSGCVADIDEVSGWITIRR